MHKSIVALIFLCMAAFARQELFPTKECPAFNNLKQTKNTHDIHLDLTKKYTILKDHKGQKLILINGEQPAQRWVDDECFSQEEVSRNPLNVQRVESKVIALEDECNETSKVTVLPKYTKEYEYENTKKYEYEKVSKQNILTLSWHNAFCETHRYKKECKRSLFSFGRPNYSERHFVLHGLWPQPKNRLYCGVDSHTVAMDKHGQWNRIPDIDLSNEIKVRLQKVMPGYASELHKHEWIKHGTCYGTDANKYYEDAIRMVEQTNDSKVGDFFKNQIGKQVTLQQVRAVFDRSFGMGSGKRVELKCHNGLITELWLHLGSGSEELGMLLQQGKQIRSQCQGGFVDKAGF